MRYALNYFEDLYHAIKQQIDVLNLNPKRLFEYFMMFYVLSLIYSNYLVDFLDARNRDMSILDTALFSTLAKFSLHMGWPFLILAFLDKQWQSKDTQRVAALTFVLCTAFWMHKYHLNACLLGASMLFVPLFFSALFFHWLGTCRHQKETP